MNQTPALSEIEVPRLSEAERSSVYHLESDLRDKAREYLGRLANAKVIKLHGSAFSEAGVPDTILIWLGLAVWFEWKRPGEKAKRHQLLQMHRLSHAGSPTAVCRSLRDVEEVLDTIRETRLASLASGRAAWLIEIGAPSEIRR